MDLEKRIDVALGNAPADLLLINGRVVNVFSGEIENVSVAIAGSRIAGLGEYSSAAEIIDLEGRFLLPGFIDAHIHIESSLLTPAAFAAAAIAHGTSAVIADPHEIVNVGGLEAWRYMIEASRCLPVDILYTVPSCVPATHMETSGASMGAGEIAAAFDTFPGSPALAEMMNYPGVLFKDPRVMEILREATNRGKRLDGHAPLVGGNSLNAYIGAGLSSDHECTILEEAREKMRLGMQILIREGSGARILETLLPLVNTSNESSFCFCCDDRHAGDLLDDGEIDSILRKAVALGMPAVQAVRLATINPARHYGLRDRGAVAPGYRADLAVVDDLHDFNVAMVFKNGQIAYQRETNSGRTLSTVNEPQAVSESAMADTVHLPDIAGRLIAEIPEGVKQVRVIEATPEQILTRALLIPPGELEAAGVNYLAVIERHGKNGNIGTGFVKGLGLSKGALASTVAHDSHNLIVAGCDGASMELAARTLASLGGGLCAVSGGQVLASLALPVGGLMSPRPAAEVAAACAELEAAAHSLGCALPAPFITLSFLALPVIPELRLTDRGLVDVNAFDMVPPWL